MTDPIADMLTRLRNGLAVAKKDIILPYSKLKHEVAKILVDQLYIEKAEIIKAEKDKFRSLRVILKYKDGKPWIKGLKKISKPGLKIYVKKDKLPYVLNNLGIAIISTSQGLMTNKQARKKGLGGEVICEIY